MPRLAYVNGRFLPHKAAAVHIEDRGYQFADGVYEVTPVVDGTLVDEAPHLDRLERSLHELRIALPMSRQAIRLVSRELMRRNALSNGFIYIQVTRGVAPRDHAFPRVAEPALVMTTRQKKSPGGTILTEGVGVITIPDIRWKRCDIKSVSLLPNILGKQEAIEAGAYEAWMVDRDGLVSEGTSTNAWIVNEDSELVTRNASQAILNGITRLRVLDLAAKEKISFVERPFTVEEATRAREAFLTSSTSFVMPVTRIDGQAIGNGHPGILTSRLLESYRGFIEDLGNST